MKREVAEVPVPEASELIDTVDEILPQCPGITDGLLQQYASLPPPAGRDNHSPYYLHVEYLKINGRMIATSTVHAYACMPTAQTGAACAACGQCR